MTKIKKSFVSDENEFYIFNDESFSSQVTLNKNNNFNFHFS